MLRRCPQVKSVAASSCPIRAVLLRAYRRGWCDRPSFEIPRENEGRTRYLLPDEAERLIAAAAPHLQTSLILLLGEPACEWPKPSNSIGAMSASTVGG